MEVAMGSNAGNPVKQRRAELKLTQQEAARRAEVALATWRRFENSAADAKGLKGFRASNLTGFARALKVKVDDLHNLVTGISVEPGATDDPFGMAAIIQLFNESFKGDPLTPADAMALSDTVDFSDFAPTEDGRLHLQHGFTGEFASYLKGEVTIREVELLCDLPEMVLTQVNDHWLVRMGERIMRIGSELNHGRVPRPVCLADEYALLLVITNSEPPQLGELAERYPDLLSAEDVFGSDPDIDEFEEDDFEIRTEWKDRMIVGLLPPDSSHDFRRYDLTIMDHYGQGVYDPSDSRHPLRWFDRDDLRARCESELEFVRLPKEQQEARTREALARMSMFFGTEPTSQDDR
ncbi:helix-turn-helix transcriptional regulator [Glycomyces sp. NPDC049804]|uniref:helix-turn-helix transcriptional regulator n=1 Tax=Glycomyces sp. NPDC049804 TaxID=3154363 RepID=UPI0034485277